MSLNAMQEAFVNAALKTTNKRAFNRVAKVAERIKVREPKDHIRLSYRTAQKLKAQGVIA